MKTGSGALTLSGSNSYAGPTTVSGGQLVAADNFAIGAGTAALTVNTGGRLSLGNGVNVSRSGSITLIGGTISGGTLTNTGTALDVRNGAISSAIAGTPGLVKTTSGTVSLSGANTYSGTTTVSAGILSVTTASALSGWNAANRVTVSTGAALVVGNGVTDAELDTIRTSGSFAANAFIGFDTDGSGTYAGAGIANTANVLGLMKVGSGTETLNTANTYTGTTAINDGMLRLGVGNAIASSSMVSLSGNGRLGFASTLTSATLTTISSTTPILLQNDSAQAVALSLGNGNVTTNLSSEFTGPGSLVKIGTGTLTVSGSNSYSGTTRLGGGVLSLGNTNALAGGGNILFAGGTMQFGVLGTLTNAVVGSTSAMAFDTGSQSVAISTPLASSNVAGLTKLGSGTLTLAGNSLYSGTTTVSAGVLRASGNSAFGTNSAVSLTNAAGVGLDLNGYSATIGSLSGGGSLGGGVNLSTGTLTVGTSNANSTYSGVFTGAGSVVKTGVGTLTLTPAVSSTMSLAVNGGLVAITPPAGLTVGTGTITRSVGGMVSFPVSTGTVATSTPLTNGIIGPWAVTGTTYATTASGIVVPYTSGSSVTTSYSTSLIDTTGTMNYDVFMNSGSPASTFSANTIRFYSGSGGRTLTPGATLFAVNGLLNVDATSMTIGSGTIRSGTTRELVIAQGAGTGGGFTVNSSIADSLSGSSSLTLWAFANATTFTLNGANTFTGDITMVGAAGSLVLGSGSFHAATTGNVFLSQGASLTVNNNGPQSMGNIVGVGSTLTKTGIGVLTLSSATSSFTGLVRINAGTLSVSSLGMAGSISGLGTSGTINVGTSSTTGALRYTGTGETTDRVINLSGTTGGATLEANGSGPLVFTSAITATGTGAKTLTLAGSSTAANAIVSVPNGAGTTSVDKTGSGLWRLTGASDYSGQLRVLDGTLVVASTVPSQNASPFGTGTGTIVGSSAAGATGTTALLIDGATISRGFSVAASGSNGSQVVVLGGTGTGTNRFDSGIAILLGRSVTLQASTGGTVEFASNWRDSAGNLSPNVGFTVGSAGNAGTVIFSNSLPTSITGIDAVAGTARLNGGTDTIWYTTPVSLGSADSPATLDLNGLSQALASLSFNGNSSVVSSGVAGGTLRLFSNGTATASVAVSGTGHVISAAMALDDAAGFNVASGGRLRVTGAIATGPAGAKSLTKTGAGILELSGANTYSGNTTVSAGTFVVNGSLGSGALSVAAAAKLMGSGTIGGAATIAGIHSPGNSPGIETFSSNLSYTGSSSQVIWELWNNTISNSPLAYDQIIVGGNLDFAGATSLTLDFGGSGVGSVDWDDPFWGSDQTWTLFDVAGTTLNFGNFSLTNSPASWLDASGLAFGSSTRKDNSFSVTQQGSDVLIQYAVVIPEPSSLALAGLGIAAAAWAARRGSRSSGRR